MLNHKKKKHFMLIRDSKTKIGKEVVILQKDQLPINKSMPNINEIKSNENVAQKQEVGVAKKPLFTYISKQFKDVFGNVHKMVYNVYNCHTLKDSYNSQKLTDAMLSVKQSLFDIFNKNLLTSGSKVRTAKTIVTTVEDILSYLDRSTLERKEKILRSLAFKGIPLPGGKTISEKYLVNVVHADLGLPPVPRTLLAKNKFDKAIIAGLIAPLEGKTPKEKEEILRREHQAGIRLPEGRSSSERNLIEKIKKESPHKVKIPFEKLKKARRAGLLVPLQEKSREEKEYILKGLAELEIPFPESKTTSEQILIEKIRSELGLPPEPKTSKERQIYNTALALGIIKPLKNKSLLLKELILTRMAKAGIKFPTARTPSEEEIIKKVKYETRCFTRNKESKESSSCEQYQNESTINIPKMNSVLLNNSALLRKHCFDDMQWQEYNSRSFKNDYRIKTPKESQQILCVNSSKLELNCQSRMLYRNSTELNSTEMNSTELNVQHHTYEKSQSKLSNVLRLRTAPRRQENILRALAKTGIPLPVGRTPLEEKMINKIRLDMRLPPPPVTHKAKVQYEKKRTCAIVDLLKDKSRVEKDYMIEHLAKVGMPLPVDFLSYSEKQIIDEINDRITKQIIDEINNRITKELPPENLKLFETRCFTTKLKRDLTEANEKKSLQNITYSTSKWSLFNNPRSMSDVQRVDRREFNDYITTYTHKKPKAATLIPRSTNRTPNLFALQQSQVENPYPKKNTHLNNELTAKVEVQSRDIYEKLTPIDLNTKQQENVLKASLKKETGVVVPQYKRKHSYSPSPICEVEHPYHKAMIAGIITLIENKTQAEKDVLLKQLAEVGILFPAEQTSEYALVEEIKKENNMNRTDLPLITMSSENINKTQCFKGPSRRRIHRNQKSYDNLVSIIEKFGCRHKSNENMTRLTDKRYLGHSATSFSEDEIVSKSNATDLLTLLRCENNYNLHPVQSEIKTLKKPIDKSTNHEAIAKQKVDRSSACINRNKFRNNCIRIKINPSNKPGLKQAKIKKYDVKVQSKEGTKEGVQYIIGNAVGVSAIANDFYSRERNSDTVCTVTSNSAPDLTSSVSNDSLLNCLSNQIQRNNASSHISNRTISSSNENDFLNNSVDIIKYNISDSLSHSTNLNYIILCSKTSPSKRQVGKENQSSLYSKTSEEPLTSELETDGDLYSNPKIMSINVSFQTFNTLSENAQECFYEHLSSERHFPFRVSAPSENSNVSDNERQDFEDESDEVLSDTISYNEESIHKSNYSSHDLFNDKNRMILDEMITAKSFITSSSLSVIPNSEILAQ